jgi:hypothetical protein
MLLSERWWNAHRCGSGDRRLGLIRGGVRIFVGLLFFCGADVILVREVRVAGGHVLANEQLHEDPKSAQVAQHRWCVVCRRRHTRCQSQLLKQH